MLIRPIGILRQLLFIHLFACNGNVCAFRPNES